MSEEPQPPSHPSTARGVVLVIAPFVARLMHLDTLGEDGTDHALAGQDAIGEPAAAGIPTDRERK